MLTVTVYPSDPESTDDGAVFENIDFVSLVNNQTYGPPALVAPAGDKPPTAKVGQRVLYVNTNLVALFEVERTTD